VSRDRIVSQKDLGEETLAAFEAMDRYDPDPTWRVVDDEP